MPKQRVYGSPIGTEEPSGDRDRPKAKPPDPDKVREALNKFNTRVPVAEKRVRGSSATATRKLRPPPLLDAEIEKQSQ